MVLYFRAFSGGFDLTAEWMGWNNVFHCEWNEFGQKVLKHYWPNAISYGDITKTDFTIHRGNIDILTGGFPCQPFSLAGKRKGTADERHLWPEMLRTIREIQPAWVVGENVFGLINWDGGMVFDQVQADLEAEGYEVQPYVLPACAVNAPHRRDRVWFVAYAKSLSCRDGVRNEKHRTQEIQKKRLNELISSPNTTGDAITGQNGESNPTERTRATADDKVGRGQFEAVQPEGLHDISRYASDTSNTGLERCEIGRSIDKFWKKSHEQPTRFIRPTWDNFPTQPPVRTGDDGLSSGLAGITVSKHRNESIKAAGNAIVPQVAFQIFKAIEQYENDPSRRT